MATDPALEISHAERGAWPDLFDDQLEALRPDGTTRAVSPGETLFRAGDPSYDFVVILAGRVMVVEDYGRSPSTGLGASSASSAS
jgi:CRP-like cAMP-binding protein